MKKLLIQGLGAATIFSFSIMPVLGAPNGPAPRATGGISYEAAGLDRQAQFQMHDGDAVGKTDKGMFKYSDANGVPVSVGIAVFKHSFIGYSKCMTVMLSEKPIKECLNTAMPTETGTPLR